MRKLEKSLENSSVRQVLIVLLFLVAFFFISLLLGDFSKDIRKQQQQLAEERLEGIAMQSSSYVNNMFTDYVDYINSTAVSAAIYEDLTSPEIMNFLNNTNKSSIFERLAIDFPEGKTYTSDGYMFDVRDFNYTHRIYDKKTFITDMFVSKADSQPSVSIIAPIIKNNQAVAAVRGTIYTQNLDSLIDAKVFNGAGYFYLIDSQGHILSKPKNPNMLFPEGVDFFQMLREITVAPGNSNESIINDIKTGKSGSAAYKLGTESRYTYYMPVGINDWFVFVSIPSNYIDSSTDIITNNAAALVGKISAVLFVCFLLVLHMMKRSRIELKRINDRFELMTAVIPGGIIITEAVGDFPSIYVNQGLYDLIGYTKEEFATKFNNKGLAALHPDDRRKILLSIKKQIAASGSFNVNVRLQHKTKGYIWVHLQGRLYNDNNDTDRIYMVAVDISEQLELSSQLQDEKTFNSIISNLAEEDYFYYDNLNKTIRYSKNLANKMGVSEVLTNYPQSFLDIGVLAEESKHLYTTNRFNSNKHGTIEEEVHLNLPNGEDLWYLIKYNIIFNEAGKPIKAVGKMIDITKQGVRMSELADKAKKDPLTNLYNKTATEQLITETLATATTSEQHALMIVDIDNFKNVNDQMGHLYGDIFLKNFATMLKSMFRADDIIGRIGGDEFFVLLKNFNSTNMICNKASKLCTAFKQAHENTEHDYKTSVSIGIALFPDHGNNLATLYKNADKALYEVKRNGKNNFRIYSDTLSNSDNYNDQA